MTLPLQLREVLPPATAHAWEQIASVLPAGCYLAGGTALAVRLRHRKSRDLDFFFDDPALDLEALEVKLASLGDFVATRRAAGTLNGGLHGAAIQFLHAVGQTNLEQPEVVAGLPVCGLADVFAMKVKVIGDRGELRDYFDLKRIEEMEGRMFEEGIGLYMARYNVAPEHASIPHIVRALGSLDDVSADSALPETKTEIARYWKRRQPEIVRNLSRHAPRRSAPNLPPRGTPK